MQPSNKGLYADNVICINSLIPTSAEKACVLAEEIEHYCTSAGDILDQSKTKNRKQELLARTRAYKRLIPLFKIVQANKEGIHHRHELAEYLGVTETFLSEALKRYQEIYGTHTTHKEFAIYFEPLEVTKIYE